MPFISKYQHLGSTSSVSSVIQQNLFIEKNSQEIVYLENDESKLQKDDIEQTIINDDGLVVEEEEEAEDDDGQEQEPEEEECEFVEEELCNADDQYAANVAVSQQVNKQSVEKTVKSKKIGKDDKTHNAGWTCQICKKEYSGMYSSI